MYTVGQIMLLAVANTYRNWHLLNFFSASYSVFLIFILWIFIPESPSYLISAGKEEDAEKLIRKIDLFNNKIPSECFYANGTFQKFLNEKKVYEASQNQEISTIILQKKNLRTLFLFIFIWFAVYLLYFGVFWRILGYFWAYFITFYQKPNLIKLI
jgi:hypothetical protein